RVAPRNCARQTAIPRCHYQQSKTRHSTHIRAQSNSMLDASDGGLAAASCPSDALPVRVDNHSRHTPSRALLCRFYSYSLPVDKKRCMRTRIDRAEIVPSILIIYEVVHTACCLPISRPHFLLAY